MKRIIIGVVWPLALLFGFGCSSVPVTEKKAPSEHGAAHPRAFSPASTETELTPAITEADSLPRVVQRLIDPPFLPEHEQVATDGPKVVQVRMVAKQREIEIEPGVFYQALTFNGSIPGPAIVVHEGDYVEVTLVNETENLLHNLDFHAATGAMGGGALSQVQSGEEMTFRFKATRAGAFVYHCAPGGIMIPYHVASGMNGMILVLPRDGFKDEKGKPIHYDRAWYIGEQDFYVPTDNQGRFLRFSSPLEALPKVLEAMKQGVPSHAVFNGRKDALTGKNALQAKVGETVLIIHSEANRPSYPHIIGGHADWFWEGGSFANTPDRDLETWIVPAGAAVAAVYMFREPGKYIYVTHNLIDAVMKGASLHIDVEGERNDDLMQVITSAHKSR